MKVENILNRYNDRSKDIVVYFKKKQYQDSYEYYVKNKQIEDLNAQRIVFLNEVLIREDYIFLTGKGKPVKVSYNFIQSNPELMSLLSTKEIRDLINLARDPKYKNNSVRFFSTRTYILIGLDIQSQTPRLIQFEMPFSLLKQVLNYFLQYEKMKENIHTFVNVDDIENEFADGYFVWKILLGDLNSNEIEGGQNVQQKIFKQVQFKMKQTQSESEDGKEEEEVVRHYFSLNDIKPIILEEKIKERYKSFQKLILSNYQNKERSEEICQGIEEFQKQFRESLQIREKQRSTVYKDNEQVSAQAKSKMNFEKAQQEKTEPKSTAIKKEDFISSADTDENTDKNNFDNIFDDLLENIRNISSENNGEDIFGLIQSDDNISEDDLPPF